MKNFTLVLSIICCVFSSHAQSIAPPELPAEKIIISEYFKQGNGPTFAVTATQKRIWINGEVIFQTQTADIVSMTGKLLFPNKLLVLTREHGENYLVEMTYNSLTGEWTTEYLDFISSYSMNSFIGDALYAMAYDAIYVSDSG